MSFGHEDNEWLIPRSDRSALKKTPKYWTPGFVVFENWYVNHLRLLLANHLFPLSEIYLNSSKWNANSLLWLALIGKRSTVTPQKQIICDVIWTSFKTISFWINFNYSSYIKFMTGVRNIWWRKKLYNIVFTETQQLR
jgi:hypothetical protein